MATPAPAGSATTGGAPRSIDDASLVYHVNIVFVVVIAVFILVKLPRAFALFRTTSERLNGHILRHIPYQPSRRVSQAIHNTYPPPSSKEYTTDDSHTLYSHAHHVQRLTEKGGPMVTRYPPHVPACIKFLRPLLKPLRSRIVPGFSVAQLVLLLFYFYVLIYAAFYKSNIFTDTNRTAWIAIAQLPFIFAFAQKNNVLGSILGFGYEKINFLHRFAGRLVVLAANIHAFHFFYQWTLAGTFKKSIARPSVIWSMVALVCLDMLFFFSTQYWRQKAYNVFLSTHVIGFVLILPATYLHQPSVLPYISVCIALYIFDHLCRLLKSRLTTAHIRPLPELDLTRVEIPSVNAGWRAGQHIRLRVLSLQMGWLGWAEEHDRERMVLMCKRAGGWTKKLYEIAKMGGYTEGGVGREVKVVVEGPYGGPGHTVFSSFSAAVFVAGGSGITYALSAIQDVVQKDLRGENRVKVIELVWTVRDPACLVPLLPALTSLIHQSVFTPLRISVFYTRAPTGKQPAFFTYTDAALVDPASPIHPSSPGYFPPGLTLSPGRPRIAKILEGAIQLAITLGSGVKDNERITGMVVGVCGPVGLADDVVQAVAGLDPLKRDQVGGVEICEEVFGW